jgi:ParB family transcriptional regulator, chromosome partitioning protein
MLKSTDTAKRRTALGQGLNALLPMEPLVDQSPPDRTIVDVPVASLTPNPYQPRRTFVEESLEDLSRSIKEMGVIQPLIVRSVPDGMYEIVAGERRWRAARMAGFTMIPVMVRDVSDSESLEIALIENLQRENLNPLDTAEAYDLLIEKFSYTHEALAKRIGKDRSNITNYLRLLKLPDPVKEFLRQEQLTMGHARTLLAVEHMPTQLNLSQRVVKRKLSVRELERIVQNYKKKQEASASASRGTSSGTSSLETALCRHFATRVALRQKADGSGKLEMHFHSTEELERLLESMGYSEESGGR